jgi:hypothetical protein
MTANLPLANPLRLPRRVEPEMLDTLPAADRRALRARQDLRRINRVMAAPTLLCRGIERATRGRPPRALVELGAGDGTLLLRIAQCRAGAWPGVEATLVDRQDLVSPATRQGFAKLGWKLSVVTREVFDWLDATPPVPHDLLVANLFLHHFAGSALQRLLFGIAARSAAFVACEPRRAATALFASHLVGCIGGNAVTRHDAVASVHAGFRAAELTAAWPSDAAWTLDEYAAGLFSHCFVAQRKDNLTGPR